MTDSTGSPTLLPLTAAQQGIWNAQKLDPTSPYYVVGEVLELGRVDTCLLAQAVALTVDESETLRLRFLEDADGADGPRQYVDHSPAEFPEIRDISGAPDPELLATAIIDAEKVECGSAWCGMTSPDAGPSNPLHRFLILDLGDAVWCVQLYHHIIVDGYSAALLTRRTAAHYTELAGGRKARPAKFATMAEIVASDLEYRDSDVYGEDRDFWRDHLTPAPDTTGREDLVHGAGTPSITTSLRLDREEMAELRTRAESHGLVWSDMVLGAYGAWLRKLGVAGENPAEALIAMPMMARTTGPLRRTPAMQVNMVPVRFPLDAGATVPEIADAAHTALEQVRTHQRYPGSDLVRDLSRDPEVGLNGPAVLHGIGVNLKTFDFSLDFHGTSGVLRNIAGGPPEDLVLVVTPTTGGAGEAVDLAFETDPTSVDAATATQRLEDIRALLFAEGPVSQIRLRDETTLASWADERAGSPLPDAASTLDELIDSMTGTVADDSTTLSSEEFSRRVTEGAARIAESCQENGVIALDLPKGVDLAAAVLATWRAHRAFVVLDREHPEARRQHILADSGAVAVLTEDGITATGASTAAVSKPQRPDADLAYLLYTSGTTGTPKGVEVTRTGVEALLAGHFQELYPSASLSAAAAAVPPGHAPLHVAHTASFSFDAAIDQLAWVFTGATVHLYSHGTVGDPEQMRSALLRDRVDVLDATPSLAGALIDSGALDATEVSTLILGGESVPQSLWDRLAASDRVDAWNVYGPTEATVDALAARIVPGPVTIGRAVPGMTAEILDVDGEVVPPNEIGELVLSGPQVALGYRGRPDATAFETVENGDGSRRRYRTGDRVRWRADVAATEFLGRADDQLEIRGHRVEPGEVEAALLALPQVTGAAVGTFGPSGAVKLIAHVTLTAEAAAQQPAFDVRQALAAHVPGHLVPTTVRVHDRLPLTVGGKVDRRALDALAAQDETTADAADAPDRDADLDQDLSPTERQLAEVVAELLGADDTDNSADTVNIEADFISLGGDSIGALTVAGRLRQRGVGIQAGDLLSGSTLRDIAADAEEVTTTGDSALLDAAVSTASVDSGATEVSTGPHALARTAPGQRPVLVGTVTLDATSEAELDHSLSSTIGALMTRHGDLRAVLDRYDSKHDEPRMIVPRVPLVDPSDLLVDLESDESSVAELADSFASRLDPAAGRTWCVGVRHGAGSTDLVVAVDPLLRSPAGVTELLDELADALDGQVVARAEGGHGRTVTVHDTEAILDVLPELFTADALAAPAAAALLATNGPVAVWLPADAENPGGEVLTLPPLDEDTRTTTDPARRALLHAKEHLVNRTDATDQNDSPALTVATVPGADTLTPASGTDILFLDMSTGEAVLHGVLPDGETDDLTTALTDAFTGLAVLARTSDGGASPADLTHRADQQTIDAWETTYGPLADVLPVAPLQEGLLYHAANGGDGYVLAAGIDLRGRVDADRLHASLLQVLDRHDLLRARFDTSTLDEPVQVLPRTVELPWRTVDLTALPAEDALATAEVRLHAMASRPMDIEHLARGPLVAAELVLLPDDRAWLVLGNHHLVTDGWSTPVMLRDLLSFYHGDPLPDAAPYSDYLDWLGRRDARVDEDAWSERLDGLAHGTLVREIAPPPADTADDDTDDAPQRGESLREVTGDGSLSPDALLSRASEAGVTPNTLLQAAWSLSLSSLTGDSDVLFGTTVSGRPTELPGISNTVGLFINTVPARVTVDKDQDLNGLLSTIGRTQARMTAHDATPLVRIEQLAGCGPLFDSLVVHDNFPAADTSDDADPDTISVGGIHTDGRTDFPVSVVSPPGDTFRIVLAYRPDLVDSRFIDLAHRTLVRVLESFVADPGTRVGTVLDGLPGQWASSAAPQQDAPEAPAQEEAPAAPAAASGAASDTAETIAEVMAALLDRHPVGVHENFFDIGGHSLLAMRLLGRLRRAGLEKVTIQDIVESGSPSALATRLDGDGTQSVLPLSPGTGPPLFCVHPGGGLALPFQGLADRLADRLDESGPLVGLQLPSPLPQAATLDELAAPYADQVQQVQEHGPYRLLGYSFGGALAHAMTAELQRRGETVSYLGVMDAYPAGESPDLPAADEAPDPADDDLAAMGGIGDDEVTEMITGNLRYCDQLLRTATPVDTNGFDGTVQVIVASRAGQGAAPATWDPVPAWSTTLGREPESLTLDTDHAGLVSDDGWDSIAPFIGRALTGQDAPSPSQEILI